MILNIILLQATHFDNNFEDALQGSNYIEDSIGILLTIGILLYLYKRIKNK